MTRIGYHLPAVYQIITAFRCRITEVYGLNDINMLVTIYTFKIWDNSSMGLDHAKG